MEIKVFVLVVIFIVWNSRSTVQIKSSITLPAEGDVVDLLQLYDIRTGKILILNLLSENPENHSKSVRRGYTSSTQTVIKTSTDYVDETNLSGELQLNALFSLFQGGGETSGRFKNKLKTSSNSIIGNIKIEEGSEYEHVRVCDKSVFHLINAEFLNKTYVNATHVIIGRQWGLNLHISFISSNDYGESHQLIESKLKADMKLAMLKLTADVEVKTSTQNTSSNLKYSIEVQSNIPMLYNYPNEYSELAPFLKRLPEIVNATEGQKGGIISYELIDLDEIIKCTQSKIKNDPIAKIVQQNILLIKSTLTRLEEKTQKVNDLLQSFLNYDDCIPEHIIKKLVSFKLKFDESSISFRDSLKQIIENVRFGRSSNQELIRFIGNYTNSDMSGENAYYYVTLYFSEWIDKIELYKDFNANNISCLSTTTNLPTLFSTYYYKHFTFFLYTYKDMLLSPNYIKTSHAFKTNCGVCTTNCQCYYVDCDLDFDALCGDYNDIEIRNYVKGTYEILEYSKLFEAFKDVVINEEQRHYEIVNATLYLYRIASIYKDLLRGLEIKTENYVTELRNFVNKTHTIRHDDFTIFSNIHTLYNLSILDFSGTNKSKMNPVEILFKNFIDYSD